jgi:hypothetical protein
MFKEIYTYAFLKSDISASLDLPNGQFDQVQIIHTGNLAALIEPNISINSLKQDENTLIRAVISHHSIIGHVFSQTTLLPLRFGTCFISLEDLSTYLKQNEQPYLVKLNHFEGKAEYSIKLIPRDLPLDNQNISLDNSPHKSGRQYFLAKKQLHQIQLAHQQQRAEEKDKFISLISQTFPEYLQTDGPTSPLTTIYILTHREDTQTLNEIVHNFQINCNYWDFQVESLIPPYHFL